MRDLMPSKRERRLFLDANNSTLTTELYQHYDEPLISEGNAVVIPDLELPFHHVDFINKVLDLAKLWKIKLCIMAGDVIHNDSLTPFDPKWINKPEAGGISAEWGEARRELKRISRQFDRLDYVIGNHEGRLLRKMQTSMSPDELLRILEIKDEKWRIAPYYFSYLKTEGGTYLIEHPKGYAKFSASRLASKYLCHILMAHSHQLVFTRDPSNQFYAIEMGCGADESMFAYAAQRHNFSPAHGLGAVIVRNGYPWLLHSGTDWKALARI